MRSDEHPLDRLLRMKKRAKAARAHPRIIERIEGRVKEETERCLNEGKYEEDQSIQHIQRGGRPGERDPTDV